EAADRAIDVLDPQRQRVADLLVRTAEDDDDAGNAGEQRESLRHAGLVPLLSNDRLHRRDARRLGRQITAAEDIDQQAAHHADAREREAPVPAVQLADGAAAERREEAADIHAEVVIVVRGRAPRIVVAIQAGNLARQARQEQAVAETDGRER